MPFCGRVAGRRSSGCPQIRWIDVMRKDIWWRFGVLAWGTVLNSAARIVSNTRKFDRGLTHFRQSQLHWLDVVDRVRFRVCIQVFRCLHKIAPEYLSTYCQPVSGISGRRHLRSADHGHLDFPHVKLASYGGRSFAYAGPSNWKSLPAHLRDNSLFFIF